MPRFHEDKYREAVLGEFLETRLYPHVATDFERVSTARDQKAGHDVVVKFDWLSETVVADEKAQNSDKWINDPVPTFVMEIFGESWLTDGEPDGNTGWFVDPTNETEYYVMVWLPDVSIFKLVNGVDEYPYLVYVPADAVTFDPETIAETAPSDVHYKMNPSTGEYRLELTPDVVDAFEAAVEPLPDVLTGPSDADLDEWYYDPGHIHVAKVVIVEKSKVRKTLATDGLTREVLVEMGQTAVTQGTVDVDSEKARYVKRSGGKQSGSADDEHPVNLVVKYDTYHEIADKTLQYENGSWSEDVRLF